MKRFGVVFITGFLSVFAALMAVAAPISIVNSKHNLSSSGSGTIRSLDPASGGTTEVCVFCHTPHSARTDAPLWNKSNPVGPYTVYASDVMSALSITPESPVNIAEPGYAIHVKTRICMSCHDGTIALGNLVNLPSGMSLPVQMQGTSGGMMPASVPGYLGTDLRDDHPVAIKHKDPLHSDPELQSIAGSKVRLYYWDGVRVRSNQTDGNYIECTSCHDAHDNQYGKFLIDDNVGSKICTSCHNKQGDDSTVANESVHSNTTISTAYSVPGIGSSVQNVKCMDCHFPHKAGVLPTDMNTPQPAYGKYLLTFQEEKSCYNTPNRWNQANSSCHDVGGAGKNIKSEVTKGSAHRVEFYSAASQPHNATEGRNGANWSNQPGNSWHVECDDCHNSHTAGGLIHTNGTNAVSSTSPIYGAGGIEPAWPAGNWVVPNTFTYKEPIGLTTNPTSSIVTHEYQVCLRCHSTFAWNSAPVGMTDQALEFNINNSSYHSVVRVNPASFGTTSWTGGSGFGNASTMYCSDCHGNNAASPKGPHGSTNSHLLVGPGGGFVDYYTPKGTDQPTTDVCFNCHDVVAYQTGSATTSGTGFRTTGGVNLHTQHRILSSSSSTSTTGYVCVNCHTKIPHGYKNKALIVLGTDGPEVATYAAGGTAKITSATLPASLNYSPIKTVDCSTANGCHQ